MYPKKVVIVTLSEIISQRIDIGLAPSALRMPNSWVRSRTVISKPWFEWCVLGVVAVITLLVAFGYTMAATVILAVTAIITGLVRLILQDRSPWKVRSVAFDSFIGIALGIGLLITYFSFFGLFGNIFFR